MNKKKLYTLFKKISEYAYLPEALQNVETFQERLASDLDTNKNEAMALLGYLLANHYAKISPEDGLTINTANKEVRETLRKGRFDEGG